MAFTYHINDRTLLFHDFRPNDLEPSLRQVYDATNLGETHATVRNEGHEAEGIVEGHWVVPTMPPAIDRAVWCHKTSGELYRIITCDDRSPFVDLKIPGVLYLLNRNAVACSPILNIFSGTVARAVFNIAPGQVHWRTRDEDMDVHYRREYGNLAHIAQFLGVPQQPVAKKPADTPVLDLEKVLTSVFGAAIASAITKEIK